MRRGGSNGYIAELPDFDRTPKAVYAAIALSLAVCQVGRDDEKGFELARALLRGEWQALHASGIVPQKPPPGETLRLAAERSDAEPGRTSPDA